MQFKDSALRRYYTVQALRGLAALMVVVTHTMVMMYEKRGWDDVSVFFASGAAGVDIFFCISGFVMGITLPKYWGQAKGWLSFLWHRILRIMPLYWVLTAFKILLLFVLPGVATYTVLTPGHTLASFLFLPIPNVQGEFAPIIQVGWTLNFEMFFYVAFSLVLFFQKNPLIWLSVILGALGIAALFYSGPVNPFIYYMSPLLLEFVFGMLIALLVMRGHKLPSLLCLILPIVSFLAIISFPFFDVLTPADGEALAINTVPFNNAHQPLRIFMWGIPAALIVWSFVSMEDKWGRFCKGWISLLGDSSYSLYLIHLFVMTFFSIALGYLPFRIMGVEIALCIFTSVAAGIILYLILEKPMIKKLRSL